MKNAEKNKSVSRRSLLLLLVGFAFFINPVPLGLDLIPDVFGCVLIFFGLTQTAFFDGAVEKARKCIVYLFVVEFLKLLFMRSIFLSEIGSNRLLAVTVFSILQGIIYVMTFRLLFSGFSYFSMRNNYNSALAKCDNTAFLTHLAFSVRIAATLIPELLALIEIYLSSDSKAEIDFETLDFIESLVSSKLILVVLLTIITTVTSIVWFCSLFSFLKTLYKEAGAELDQRYTAEYSSRPEMVRPKKLKYGVYALYIALFFALDIVFDTTRIIPASFMFLGVFIAAFMLGGLSSFKKTKIFAPVAFAILLGAELHHKFLVPYGAIIIFETPIYTVVSGALICIAGASAALICIRFLLLELRELQRKLGGSEVSVTKPWIAYCITVTLWAAGYAVPYFYSYFAVARFFAAAIFIWQMIKLISFINEEENERFLMYGKTS